MPFLGFQQALTFNNIKRLELLRGRANPICGHPYGLPEKTRVPGRTVYETWVTGG